MYSRKFWIKEYITRYEFITKFCQGKILDCKFNKSTMYNSAKILLKNDTKEVITYSNKDDKIFSYTKNNDKIKFTPIDEKKNEVLQNFDCVIAFETNFGKLNFENSLDEFFNLLKKDGKLIISVINSDKIKIDQFLDNSFSKKKFLKILEKKFNYVELYSQRQLLEEYENEPSSIRKISSDFLKKIDKNRTFYIKHFQKKMKEIDEEKNQAKEIPNSDYLQEKYIEGSDPHYLIAICKK